MAAVGYSIASARAEVLALDDGDPAAVHRRAVRKWHGVPDLQFVAVVSGVESTPGAIAVIQDADQAADGPPRSAPTEVGRELSAHRPRRYMVLGVSARSAETVVLEVWARDGLAALGRAQFAGAGLPGVLLVAALGGEAAAVALTLEALPGRRARPVGGTS